MGLDLSTVRSYPFVFRGIPEQVILQIVKTQIKWSTLFVKIKKALQYFFEKCTMGYPKFIVTIYQKEESISNKGFIFVLIVLGQLYFLDSRNAHLKS